MPLKKKKKKKGDMEDATGIIHFILPLSLLYFQTNSPPKV